MACAVYARFARDEERAYKEEVSNELLRDLGFQIPMRINSFMASAIKFANDSANSRSGMTVRQAVEQIKRELLVKDIALKTIHPDLLWYLMPLQE